MEYKNIKLEKGMYKTGDKGFLDILEELDPSGGYFGTGLEGTDAFQRQLKRFDIKALGKSSDYLEKFFQNSDSAVLFPEYGKRAVLAGMEAANDVKNIIASTTIIGGTDYRSLQSKEIEANTPILEGGEIPVTDIRRQDNLVKLNKRGRLLVSSYEALKYQRLDLFTVMLGQIGRSIAKAQMEDAVKLILDGDASSAPAEVINTALAGKLTYDDMLNLWGKFEAHELNCIIAGGDTILKLAKLEEFKSPLTGFSFERAGEVGTPLGAKLVKSAFVPAGKIIGLDRTCALERIVEGAEVKVDFDKLIDRQLEKSSIISVVGFAKIFEEAGKVLKI